MKNYIFLPLLGITLMESNKLDLGFGFSISKIPKDCFEMIKGNTELQTGYASKIQELSSGLKFTSSENHLIKSVNEDNTGYYCIFICFILRALTGIPMDFPWRYIYVNNGNSKICYKTLIRTYRNDLYYIYPIDNDSYSEPIKLFKKNIKDLVKRIIDYTNGENNEDRLIRAIEFVSFAYQMPHIAPRLVNIVTFFEILFSSQRTEITHQLSERISWYLEPTNSQEREKLYNKFKMIYDGRSQVVHGDVPKKSINKLESKLIEAEELVTRTLNTILRNGHNSYFSFSKVKRDRELKKLGLGLPCEFLKY